ncbi:MAG: helix-turn-helix transcriptional regulator [Pseudonocardiales bacterium]
MTGPDPGSGPTVLRILLGSQLRQLRELKGISREDAGYTIRASESKISRMELGRVGFKERDVADLLILYGVTRPEEREALLTLVEEANAPGWWHRYNDILPGWFTSYVGLEAAAALIRSYEVQFVPGLLQTEEYARAVMAVGVERLSHEEINQRIKLRRTRQHILTKQHPVRFWGVIDEAALRRPIGGRDVMRAQFEHLITLTKAPNVTLQIIPFGAGGHAASAGAFSLLRFPDPHMPDVVYTEQVTSALYLDKRDDVDRYLQVMERLCMEADPPASTVDSLTAILEETVVGRVESID